MNYQRMITIEPGKRGGLPCVRGLRIAVADVLGCLAASMSREEILADYPELTEEDIRACLAYAADRERRPLSVQDIAERVNKLGLPRRNEAARLIREDRDR
jgi:uncharacterized protein (DUF433 family)